MILIKLTLDCSWFCEAPGTKNPVLAGIVGTEGAKIDSVGFEAAPPGLKTSTYDFFSAKINKFNNFLSF